MADEIDLDGVPRRTYEPDPSAALMKMIKEISKRLDVMERAAPKFFSITGPDGSKLSFDPVRMAGFNAAGIEVFRLNTADGAATFNGPVKIGGTLDLPAGIIGNDALASPTSPFAFHADAQTFALGNGANLPVVTVTVPVPAGFTRAVVNATASLSAANSTGSTDTLYCGIRVAGSSQGYSGRVGVAPGVAANPSKAAGVLLTSLGASFTIEGTASTFVAPWPSDSNNNANLDGTVIFLR